MGICIEKTNECILNAMNTDSLKKKISNFDNLKEMVPDMD